MCLYAFGHTARNAQEVQPDSSISCEEVRSQGSVYHCGFIMDEKLPAFRFNKL